MFKYKVYQSNNYDPRINLAFEEYFLSTVKSDEIIVFFWQSDNAVVIGRNQNPYQECNILKLDDDNVKLVRRLSGGGAVYHDLGNLNFSFIAPNVLYDPDKYFEHIIRALRAFDIEAVKSGRNDIISQERKFSGNAFITEDHASLHHGTLLIDADILKIQNYLTVSHKKLETKGFDSVSSRVVNLKELNPTVSKDTIILALVETLKEEALVERCYLPDKDKLSDFTDKYHSHLWNFGENPKFNVHMEEKFNWGLARINMQIEQGKIKEFLFDTDSLETKMFEDFNKAMHGMELSVDVIHQIVEISITDKAIADDICGLLLKEIFN